MELSIPLSDLALLIGVLLCAGLVMGTMAGLFGIGGGGILVPVLYEAFLALNVDEAICLHLSVGTSLAIIIPTSTRSFWSHRAKGAVDMDLVRSMAAPVVVGVGVGILVARFADGLVLKWVWVVCGLAMAVKLYFGPTWRLGETIPGNPYRTIYGGFVGVASTLMSIGGGVFISTFMAMYGRPMLQAVATSSAFGPLIAIPGMIGFAWAGWQVQGLPPMSLGYVSLLGVAVIAPASILAVPFGVRMAHGISRRKLELAFATFLAFVAIRFLFSLIF